VTDPWARPANQQPQGPTPPAGEPPTQQIHHQPGEYPAPPQPSQQHQQQPPEPPTPPKSAGRRFFRDPLSLTLVVVIVLALALAGVVGAELFARHVGDQTVAKATECVVQDGVEVSFGPRPFLLQYLGSHYSGIHITTAGNQLREAKGMKADIVLDDVRVADSGDSAGTIGSLNATITWSADGIKQTLQSAIPLVGSFVNGVTTNASDGTVTMNGALGDIVAKPQVVDGGVSLQVIKLTGLGFTLPREAVQPALDAFSAQLTKGYPLNIHADSIEVTDTGVISKFSAQNATMPKGPAAQQGNGSAGGGNDCFGKI
jgi:hypothetical protein